MLGGLGRLNRQDLIEWASPPCHRCDAAVESVQTMSYVDPDDESQKVIGWMICSAGHHVAVEVVDDD